VSEQTADSYRKTLLTIGAQHPAWNADPNDNLVRIFNDVTRTAREAVGAVGNDDDAKADWCENQLDGETVQDTEEESERLTKARLAEVTAMVRKMIAPERQYCRVYYQHNLPVALVLSDLVIVNDPQSKGVNSILPMGTHDGADKFVAATFPDACPYNVPPESLNELLFGLHSDRWLLASAPVINEIEQGG
jgi:hypothetical protein